MGLVAWKRFILLAALALLASLVIACGGDAAPDAEEEMAEAVKPPFRIGVMESLTGPGETYGNVSVQAKQMAVDEINAAGGINGRMIELIIEDSKCSAQDAITAYNKLTDVDGVKIILGTSCSGAMLGAAPLAEADGVILFSGLATNPDIANAGDYIFRTALSDALLGVDAGNVMWADGVRNLATISETTDYAEGVRRTSVAQFEKRGGTVVAEERYGSDTTDFRTQLTKLIGENPDALLVAAQSEFTGGTIIKQVRELGFEGQIYADIVPVGATALEIAGDAAAGTKAILADISLTTPKARRCWRIFARAMTMSRWRGFSAQAMTLSISRPSASSRPTTIRTLTACAIACTTSPGPALSARTITSTKTAKSSASPTWWWKSCP